MKSRIPPERLAEIERRLLRAESPGDFVPELALAWKRSRRRVWGYVAKVRARLAERAKGVDPDADRELIRSLALRTFRTAEAGNEYGPDTRGMVASLKLLAEMTGAATPRRPDVDGAGEVQVVFECDPPPPAPSDDGDGSPGP